MFSKEELLIAIVLYKEKLNSAEPFKCIRNDKEMDVSWFVYDNSPFADTGAYDIPSVTYLHDPSNPGVSKAYNEAASFARKMGKKWLLLFDQDTKLPADFLSNVKFHIERLPQADLYAMKLFKEQVLISPCGYRFKRGYSLKEVGEGKHTLHRYNFLNSGILIKTELFLKVGGYDESVPLYFSDYVFINRVKNVLEHFTLLPVNLAHDLSSNDMTNEDAFKFRYKLYLKGTSEAMESESDGRVAYYLMSLFRAVKMVIYFKDLFYLSSYWNILIRHKF